MNEKEFDWLVKLENNVDAHWDELSKWEKKFIENLLERFRRWGVKTLINAQEWRFIAELSEKIIP